MVAKDNQQLEVCIVSYSGLWREVYWFCKREHSEQNWADLDVGMRFCLSLIWVSKCITNAFALSLLHCFKVKTAEGSWLILLCSRIFGTRQRKVLQHCKQLKWVFFVCVFSTLSKPRNEERQKIFRQTGTKFFNIF